MVRTGIQVAFVAFVGSLLNPLQEVRAADAEQTQSRLAMVEEIVAMARATARETGRGRLSQHVLDAMAAVPRHAFVPPRLERDAYRNSPLPIGEGQTISQPYIVALSTDLIDPKPDHVVLEVGTGSGYQAAVLAKVARHVYSIEIIESLGTTAAARLASLGYDNVSVRVGDGYRGWPEHAPYDAIVVTAAAPAIPEPLIAQLKPAGRMVIPIGAHQGAQELLLVEKLPDGNIKRTVVLPVRFVPLTGKGVEQGRR